MRIFPLFLLLLLPLIRLTAQAGETFRIEGILRERGTRAPLGGVNVFVLPMKLKATTDEHGRFAVENVPAGDFEWIINSTGYQKLDMDDSQAPDEDNPLREFYLERADYQSTGLTYETVVFGKGDKRDDSVRSLKREQFLTLPGSNGDPIKAVQNLPGVNRPAPFQSQIIIQGSAPQDTRYTIDGHEVPIIFHFGGLSSVVIPEALDRVDYLSAGYGPEYGRAMGGLVGVWTRPAREDRVHGFGFVDLFNAGGLLETPVGERGSLLIGARQSYLGAVLKAALPKDKDFNLTVAPEFKDLIAVYETELTPIDRFKLVTVGSQDTLEFLFPQPVGLEPGLRGNFRNQTSFIRLIPELIHKHDETVTSRWSVGFGRDWIRFDLADDYFRLETWSLTTRGEIEKRFSSRWTSQLGFDNRFTWAKVRILVPDTFQNGGVSNPFSTSSFLQSDIDQSYRLIGAYWRNEIKIDDQERWTILPSLRIDYTSATKELLPNPRAAVRYQWSKSLLLRASGGLYSQPPQEQEVDPTFGNPDIRSPHAWHLAVAVEKDFREESSRGFTWTGGGFYRYFDRLVIPSTAFVDRGGRTVAQNVDNSGLGRAFGAESLLKFDFAPWSGWLSYTLSRSTRWSPGRAEYPFRYDQTHLLTAIGEKDLGRNWKSSVRLRYATGNPTTPITGGIFDADNDVYFPVRGAFYSTRLNAFFQADLRLDKKWIYDRWILSAYLDIQNVTNRKNLEAVQYSYDYSKQTVVSGLPILPTFGIKGEF